jgi:hypothetical protein
VGGFFVCGGTKSILVVPRNAISEAIMSDLVVLSKKKLNSKTLLEFSLEHAGSTLEIWRYRTEWDEA